LKAAMKTLDNKKNGFVYAELQEYIKKDSNLSVVSAYFTMYAYYEMKKDFNKINSMRFIFKNPSFIDTKNLEVKEFYINNNEKGIFGNEFEIKLRNEMKQSSIALECSNWIKEKVEVKSFKEIDSSQPRMIHVQNEDNEDMVIHGSVDFTTDGLGLTLSNRSDINTGIYGKEMASPYLMLFNGLWENENILEDVKEELLEQMQVIYKENPGEFVYFVSMYNVFNDYLDELTEKNIVKTGTGIKETKVWNKLYKFQKDAVIGAIDKIEKHNGCIIADSVGLGKTFTGLAIIKYYELRNDRVLVIVPKRLRENWSIYTLNDKRNIFLDDRFNYDIINHTDLSRESGESGEINLKTINWGNYDLVVIDESHNFRNNPARKDRKTRYEKLMDDIIKSGVETKVLMLSATPVNNRMTDIKNQISFITEENDKAFEDVGLKSVSQTLINAQKLFNQWSKLDDDERTGENFVDMMDLDYFKLLDTVTIARSRKHIEKYYNLDEIGKFPKRRKPFNIHSEIDTVGTFPSIKRINTQIQHLNLSIYAPMEYLLPNKRESYNEKYDIVLQTGNILKNREEHLVDLMRILLLKRMESSIHAFRLTVKRMLYKIDHVLNKIKNKEIEYNPDIDILTIDSDEEEYDELVFGNKRKILFQDIDLIKWQQDLNLDKEKLRQLFAKSKEITPVRDAKLKDLKEKIIEKIENPINNENKKILIFTAYADTAKYLYENINKWVFKKFGIYSALVTGAGDNKTSLKSIRSDYDEILTNFSPISKERDKVYDNQDKERDEIYNKEIDILIATDCISEGQNLQDCDYMINYDIHWNPVRIIQRFGRIDRIGSKNEEIQLVNFWPNMELEEYINLKGRVESRMVMVDVSTTGEENIITDGDEKKMNDLKYRRKQLEKLQDEVVDLEDVSGGISITDLTFNDFKVELMDYMKEHENELEKAPSGIYSIVKIDDEFKDELKEGIIFLLKQNKGKTEPKEQNPLSPYYLVYINEDGSIQFNYTHSKKIMDFYKKLCSGEREIFKELVLQFNKETKDGMNMQKYSNLLQIAIDSIVGKKEEIGKKSVFKKGGTNLLRNSGSEMGEFELITFLILK
jgi:ERCC4-related helicase